MLGDVDPPLVVEQLEHASGVVEDEVHADVCGQGRLSFAPTDDPNRAGHLGNVARVVDGSSDLKRPGHLNGGN